MGTVTKLNDVINPQVMGDMIEAKITAQAKLTPYAKVDTSLEGVPGDTKTVPSWNYIGDAQDFDPENRTGAEIDTTNLTASSTTFTIKCAGKSVGILQTAINSGLGNPIGQAESQLAKSIVGKVDNDVLEAAYTAPIVDIIRWKLKNEDINSGDTSKMNIQSETLSRHSVTYVQDSSETDIDGSFGVPKKYVAFLNAYKKARF